MAQEKDIDVNPCSVRVMTDLRDSLNKARLRLDRLPCGNRLWNPVTEGQRKWEEKK
jgi:hypothetical protein